MKFLVYVLTGLLVMSLFTISGYAITTDCFNGTLFYVWQLNDILVCIDDVLINHESRIAILESAGGGDLTTASNLGSIGEGIFASEVGNDLQFKKLVNGTNITLSSNGTRIMINATGVGGETTVCTDAGSVGNGLVSSSSGGNCTFKRLIDGTGIQFSINGTRITIESKSALLSGVSGSHTDTCTQSPSRGSLIFGDTNTSGACVGASTKWNELTIGAAGQYLRTNGTDVFWASGSNVTDTDDLISQSIGEIFQSLTKTNIGTAYIDIYVTAFDEENKMIIDCANVTYGNVIYQWDYVGVGTQQLRWVDASNNTNVFFESPTFTTDRDATDSGYFVKPSWCTGKVTLEQQGKSTTATDDPVAKGYKIMVK